MRKRFLLFFLFLTFILNTTVYSAKSQLFRAIKNRERRNYMSAFLANSKGDYNDYYNAKTLTSIIVDKNDFRKLNFSNKDLSKENLSKKNFSYANFKGCSLGNAKVKDANFTYAKGLTNEQKNYLRTNGAINVPINIEYDLNDDTSKVGKEIKKESKKRFQRLIRFYRWIRKLDKNAEIQVVEEELEPLSAEIQVVEEELEPLSIKS